MAEQPGKSTSVQVEVVFLEIDALYDLPGRRLVGSANESRVAIDNDLRDLLFVDYYRLPQFVDEMGAEVDGTRDDVPGMYGAVRVGDSAPFWRTFSRRRTTPIDKKYVYVFRGDSPAGENLQLEQELYFDKGQVQLVDLQANAGSDTRRPGGTRHSSVRLDVARTVAGRTVHPAYFALLAPRQIPWQRLQDVMADGSVGARSGRLGDAFWTDGFAGRDPTTAKTFHELFRGGGPPDTLGLVLYLVDPFKEALRRLEPFRKSLDRWLAKQKAMASDGRYVLAKRVDLFANAYGLQATVTPKLPAFLVDADRELLEVRLAAEDGCENLLRWIAHPQQHDRVEGADICYRNRLGIEYHPKQGQAYPTASCNPFSDAVRDYLEAGGDDCEVAKNVTHAVQSRLGETTVGAAWMNEVFDDLVGKRFPVGTAGAEMLFEGRRRGVRAPAEHWAPLFERWAPVWVKRHGPGATRSLQGWLAATYDVEIATKSVTRKGRQDQELLWIDADGTRLGKLGDAAARHVMVGFQVFNLAYSVDALRTERDVRLAAAIADLYAEGARLYAKAEPGRVTFRYAGAVEVLEVPPFASVIASTIDFVLAGRDRLNAKIGSEGIAHGLRALGTVLTVASASGDARVGTRIADLLLESAGSFLVADPEGAGVFLRRCEWGKVADLAGDPSAQMRILDELVHGDEPRVAAATSAARRES